MVRTRGAGILQATGIRVLQTRKPTGEALAQLRAEAANPKTDLWWGGTGDPYYQAAEAGLLEPYRPDYLGDLHGWAVRQYAMSANHVGGFYTSHRLRLERGSAQEEGLPAPKCWKDLLDPATSEIETLAPISAHGTDTILAGLVQMMGEEAAFDYLKKLHRNVTQYTRSGTAQARSVVRGRGHRHELHLRLRQRAAHQQVPGLRGRALRGHLLRDRRHRAGQGRATATPRSATTTGS